MAAEPNLQLWFSCDRDTGVPNSVPESVRLAWLMTTTSDLPPRPVDLLFRVQALRRTPLAMIDGMLVCPAEDGQTRRQPVTCDQCRNCWRPPVVVPQHCSLTLETSC